MTGRCVRSSVGPGFDSVESFFFLFFSLLFFFSPPLSPRLAFLFFPSFFCPPLISSSPFPLPSFLFSFYYSFPIRFLLLVSPFLLLFILSFLPLLYFPDFFLLFLSSLFLILFVVFLRSHKMTTFCGVALYIAMTDPTGRSKWILIYHFGRLCILPYPLHCYCT